MQRVANHRYLFRHGQVYYFRRAVPVEARSAFGGKKIVTTPLETSSLAEARHALGERLKEFERVVAAVRSEPDPTLHAKTTKRLQHEPTREEVDEAVRAWLRAREQDGLSAELGKGETPEEVAHELDQMRDATKLAMQARHMSPQLQTQWIAEHLAEQHGWIVQDGGAISDYLVRTVARAEMEWASIAKAEVLFEQRPAPSGVFSPALYQQDAEKAARNARHRPVAIMALFDDYCAEAQNSPATVKAWKTCLQSLVDHLGHDDATKVTKADVVGWKDVLLNPGDGKKGRSHNTISKKYLAAAKTVFGWAERNDKLVSNPVATVSIMIPKKMRLRDEPGLTDQEALTILRAASRAEPDRKPLRGFGRRWIPWLCAYTGARVGEITQLRAQDVFKHDDGIWCIRITPEAGSQKANRAREVPLHPHLIEQGFLKAIKGRTGPLFYDPGEHRGGSEGNPQHKKVAERLADWVRDLGVSDPEVQPSHGWRHRFKRVARSVRMDHEARDNIQGHAARTEGDKYGGTAMRFRYEEISKLPRYEIKED